MDVGLVVAVIGLGIVHGVLPDHGWPIAATYALQFRQRWLRGTIAALIIGVGHLVSSIALVLVYFWVAAFAAFAEGPWMKPLAGSLLILLGIYEYVSGGHGEHAHGLDEHGHGEHPYEHDHTHDPGHGHPHDHDHPHAHDAEPPHEHEHTYGNAHDADHRPNGGSATDEDDGRGVVDRLRSILPGGDHQHLREEHAQDGLRTLGTTALLLGFAHEEPIQILAICAGTEFCQELMVIYSLAVIVAILAPTLLLIAGYERHRERIEQYTPYLPALTAAVLIAVGSWFVLEGLL